MNNSEVYNRLREFHSDIKHLLNVEMEENKANAIEALHSVLYMAESEFAHDGGVTENKMRFHEREWMYHKELPKE